MSQNKTDKKNKKNKKTMNKEEKFKEIYNFNKNVNPLRVCTCDKEFIKGIPKIYVKFKEDGSKEYNELPKNIEEFEGFKELQKDIYYILGCRGCKLNLDDDNFDIKKNFNKILQASIDSCIFTKHINDKGDPVYKYLSDSIDPTFENFCNSQGIVLGQPAFIEDDGIKYANI